MKHVLEIIRESIKICLDVIKLFITAVMSILNTLARLFGFAPPDVGPGAASVPSPEEIVAAADDQPSLARGHLPGDTVHAYATATPDARATMDLVNMDPVQCAWLLSMSEDELKRLANAGPRWCQSAVVGGKNAVHGVKRLSYADAQLGTGKFDLADTRSEVLEYTFRPLKMAA